jgi:S-adenosylmethionine-dependent carboxyl methyltransferase
MDDDVAPVATAMQGAGYYNRNSDLQAAGIELALPALAAAARSVRLPETGTLTIADYGSSQGRNSLGPMRLAIEALRARCDADRPIQVVHTDLPANDFSTLFATLAQDPASYLAADPNVFAAAVGRSYFDPVLPPASVLLGWNSWTLHWMSGNPVDAPDHAFAILSADPAVRATVRRQQAEDWERFLLARATELCPDAKLVSLACGFGPDFHGWEWVIGELWAAACELGREGRLTPAELARLTLPIAGRTADDLRHPFANGGFAGLVLESAEVVAAPDPYWDRYVETGDAAEFGRTWSGLMRAVCAPVIGTAFGPDRDRAALTDALFARFEARIAAAPQRHLHFAAIAVIRKEA